MTLSDYNSSLIKSHISEGALVTTIPIFSDDEYEQLLFIVLCLLHKPTYLSYRHSY